MTPTFSIIVETDNLELAALDDLRACLDSLAGQHPALGRAEGVFLVDAGQVPKDVADELGRDYPWLTVVAAAPATLYVGLKAAGVTAAQSEVVILCDADVRYEPGWLEALLAPFAGRPEVEVVGGETSTPIGGPYSLAFALTFIFPRFTGERAPAVSPVYWANNVAMRRRVVEACPIPDPAALYRGQNILHSLALARRGVTIWRQPLARARHLVLAPRTILRRYLTLGEDAASIARLTREASGSPFLVTVAPDRNGDGRLRKLMGRLGQVARAQPLALFWLPLALPWMAVLGTCYLAGWMRRGAGRAVLDSQPGQAQ